MTTITPQSLKKRVRKQRVKDNGNKGDERKRMRERERERARDREEKRNEGARR